MSFRTFSLAAVAAAGLLLSPSFAADPTNPILFVTQVPMPDEVNSRNVAQSYMSCVSPFSNHLGGTAFAGRGGSLWVRFGPNANGSLNHQVINLLAVADWSAIPGGQPAANSVAVRNPSVHWSAAKAVFSTVIGAPTGPNDSTEFLWQLYEITLPTQAQLNANTKPVITKVANQPSYNNIMPCYAPGGKILFSSDRPYNGQAHLTQREEYLGLATVSGVWSLDPTDAASLLLLHHAPSGAFSPTVDSAGRVIFTNWDHLSRDPEAVTDSRDPLTAAPYNETFVRTFNGSGNFANEASGAAFTPVTAMAPNSWDIFPEPRNFDHKSLIDDYGNNLNGNSFNIFLPWMINPDGTTGEILNHVGRHEVGAGLAKSFKNDAAIVDLNPLVAPGYGGLAVHNFFGNLMWTREDPLHPGTFYGSDAADLGTHGAGQIISLNGGAAVNADTMVVTYVTPGATTKKPALIPTTALGSSPLTTPENLYRTPLPLASGALIASHVVVNQTDFNTGTATGPMPVSGYAFRLKSLTPGTNSAGTPGMVPENNLTNGLTITTSYFVPGQAQPVTFTNVPAWELDPAEVVASVAPTPATSTIDPIEAGQFAVAGVHLPTFQSYLRNNNSAVSISRNVTRRDRHDRQQPFNLKIAWSNTQTTGTAGTIYSVAWVQFLQADLRRGYTLGGANPITGRRIVATPMHDTMSENVATPGAPAGAVRLGDDGSFAAVVPAGKALTWHLVNNDAALTSQVKERFWVTFQRGEIRTCANCHGINTADQAGGTRPLNPPQALLDLLTLWKTNHPSGVLQHANASVSFQKDVASAMLTVTRTGGSTGPVSVDYSTANGTAIAGTDYTATSGTLTWPDGDTAPKTIPVPLLNNPLVGAPKSLGVALSNPTYGSLGALNVGTVTLTEGPLGAWRETNFGSNANTAGIGLLTDDPDGDGQDNQSEYLAGTSPLDAASVLALRTFVISGERRLAFTAHSSVSYTIQFKNALSDSDWQKLTDFPAPATTQEIEIPDTAAVPQRFYRLVTPQQP